VFSIFTVFIQNIFDFKVIALLATWYFGSYLVVVIHVEIQAEYFSEFFTFGL